MTVIAVAGRRIDSSPDGERFPLRNADLVRGRIGEVFDQFRARTLVVSAACGTDLLAIEAARMRAIRVRIILPFVASHFRETSVTDRPGDWGPVYDAAIADARMRNDLLELSHDDLPEQAAYLAVNERLIAEVWALAAQAGESALVITATEGKSHDPADITADFERRARETGIAVIHVGTRD